MLHVSRETTDFIAVVLIEVVEVEDKTSIIKTEVTQEKLKGPLRVCFVRGLICQVDVNKLRTLVYEMILCAEKGVVSSVSSRITVRLSAIYSSTVVCDAIRNIILHCVIETTASGVTEVVIV